MRLRTDPYRVDLSELAIIATFRLTETYWRFVEVFEDIERAFREDPLSYNMVRVSNLDAAREFYVAVTPGIPGCPKLRILIELAYDVVKVWALSVPADQAFDAEILQLLEDR